MVAEFVDRAGLGKSSSLDRLRVAWREIVGRRHSDETSLESFRGGLLTVGVSSSALAHELGVYYKRELLERLRSRAGLQVKDLRFRVRG